MDGRTNNLCCRVTPGLEMALAASTTAYGAQRNLIAVRAGFRFCPFCDIPEAALRAMPSG